MVRLGDMTIWAVLGWVGEIEIMNQRWSRCVDILVEDYRRQKKEIRRLQESLRDTYLQIRDANYSKEDADAYRQIAEIVRNHEC